MTLRKPIEENKDNDNERVQNELKMKAFSDMLKETARYLILHHNAYKEITGGGYDAPKSMIESYKSYVGAIIAFIGDTHMKDIYIQEFHKTLIIGSDLDADRMVWYSDKKIDSYHNIEKIRKMIDSFNNDYCSRFGRIVTNKYDHGIVLTHDTMKLNTIFWNLFLCALNDDIYNEQLPLVIELAHCFKLDEHIVADICRAVEYVLSGKKLSEDCDLHCETVECAKFFLGHE